MNRLECQVQSCQHFQNHQCCLAGIQVDGPAAQESQPDLLRLLRGAPPRRRPERAWASTPLWSRRSSAG